MRACPVWTAASACPMPRGLKRPALIKLTGVMADQAGEGPTGPIPKASARTTPNGCPVCTECPAARHGFDLSGAKPGMGPFAQG